ncbi:ATP-binding protein [Thermococcus indicus]|uniref:ATP-binding protein n=1 Tax=Thermococcus indicus TaxID=2586643 RepID=A0A4Y5SM22_9EURY|nr:ATP-binding protein [Thermococcus indicus]QDA31121.1 ATP-binding protein [Thermococcus indicus]
MTVKIVKLVRHNPWWRGEGWEREDPNLSRAKEVIPRKEIGIREGSITLLRGIRRAGKSFYIKTLVKRLISEDIPAQRIVYIPCDRFTRREVKGFIDELRLRHGELYVFLDEITYLDGWRLLLKELGEEGITTVATGSNPVELEKKAELLPGRGIEGNEYYFDPLNFREFARFMNPKLPDVSFRYSEPDVDGIFPWYEELEGLFYSYLLTGGFPEAILEFKRSRTVKEERYEEIIRLVLGEIAKSGKSEEIARELLEAIFRLRGNRVDYVTLAGEIGVSHPTVREYLSTLESARVIYTLEAWDITKKRHAHRKEKKIVFQSPLIATALAVYLGENPVEFVEANVEWLVENTVASHAIWHIEEPILREKHAFAGFYYDRNKECDLVIKEHGKFFGIEVKYGKVKRKTYSFPVIYLSKDELGKDTVPVSLYLYGLEKSRRSI